jgi:hypothetical protein
MPSLGSDECLGTLFFVVGAATWLLALPLVVIGQRQERIGMWVLAWLPVLLWVPIAWAVAIGLFFLFPSLGGA